jgi:hypothetical protein
VFIANHLVRVENWLGMSLFNLPFLVSCAKIAWFSKFACRLTRLRNGDGWVRQACGHVKNYFFVFFSKLRIKTEEKSLI